MGVNGVRWFPRNKHQSALMDEWTALQQSIEQARRDWQYAQQHVSMSEEQEAIDNAIYYMQLAEKRYMYLLDCARRYHKMYGAT